MTDNEKAGSLVVCQFEFGPLSEFSTASGLLLKCGDKLYVLYLDHNMARREILK